MFSTESGVLGGIPLTGLDMGAAVNPEAIYKTADILDLYDGGCLDLAVRPGRNGLCRKCQCFPV